MTTNGLASNLTFNGFEWDQVQIPTIRCPENRFGNETVGKGINGTYQWCPSVIKDMKLSGTMASTYSSLIEIAVTPCK